MRGTKRPAQEKLETRPPKKKKPNRPHTFFHMFPNCPEKYRLYLRDRKDISNMEVKFVSQGNFDNLQLQRAIIACRKKDEKYRLESKYQ